jgi:hypothetical protein
MGEKRDKFIKVVKVGDSAFILKLDYCPENIDAIEKAFKEQFDEIGKKSVNACNPTLENNCKTTEDN